MTPFKAYTAVTLLIMSIQLLAFEPDVTSEFGPSD